MPFGTYVTDFYASHIYIYFNLAPKRKCDLRPKTVARPIGFIIMAKNRSTENQ